MKRTTATCGLRTVSSWALPASSLRVLAVGGLLGLETIRRSYRSRDSQSTRQQSIAEAPIQRGFWQTYPVEK